MLLARPCFFTCKWPFRTHIWPNAAPGLECPVDSEPRPRSPLMTFSKSFCAVLFLLVSSLSRASRPQHPAPDLRGGPVACFDSLPTEIVLNIFARLLELEHWEGSARRVNLVKLRKRSRRLRDAIQIDKLIDMAGEEAVWEHLSRGYPKVKPSLKVWQKFLLPGRGIFESLNDSRRKMLCMACLCRGSGHRGLYTALQTYSADTATIRLAVAQLRSSLPRKYFKLSSRRSLYSMIVCRPDRPKIDTLISRMFLLLEMEALQAPDGKFKFLDTYITIPLSIENDAEWTSVIEDINDAII